MFTKPNTSLAFASVESRTSPHCSKGFTLLHYCDLCSGRVDGKRIHGHLRFCFHIHPYRFHVAFLDLMAFILSSRSSFTFWGPLFYSSRLRILSSIRRYAHRNDFFLNKSGSPCFDHILVSHSIPSCMLRRSWSRIYNSNSWFLGYVSFVAHAITNSQAFWDRSFLYISKILNIHAIYGIIWDVHPTNGRRNGWPKEGPMTPNPSKDGR